MVIEERFAQMFRNAREDAGKSQEYMANALGVSKRTIQNWESGYSSPTQLMGFKWFDVLGLQPLPYYLSLLYPDRNSVDQHSEDELIRETLIELIKDLPDDMIRKLLFILHGDHGSSPSGILELTIAHLHSPLERRLAVAQHILTNYEISALNDEISPHIRPNTELLEQSIKYGKEAVMRHDKSYNNLKGE